MSKQQESINITNADVVPDAGEKSIPHLKPMARGVTCTVMYPEIRKWSPWAHGFPKKWVPHHKIWVQYLSLTIIPAERMGTFT